MTPLQTVKAMQREGGGEIPAELYPSGWLEAAQGDERYALNLNRVCVVKTSPVKGRWAREDIVHTGAEWDDRQGERLTFGRLAVYLPCEYEPIPF